MTPILCKGNFARFPPCTGRRHRTGGYRLHSACRGIKSGAQRIFERVREIMINKWVLAVILGLAALGMYFGIMIKMS